MYQTYMVGARQASTLIGETAVVDIDYIKDWIGSTSEEVATQITNTTVTEFSKIIEEGARDGLTNAKIAQQIEEVFDKRKGYKAERIARTEVTRATSEAHRKTYEHYGFSKVKWLLAPDACDICVPLSKQKWTVKSIEGMQPVHPSCHCDFYPL